MAKDSKIIIDTFIYNKHNISFNQYKPTNENANILFENIFDKTIEEVSVIIYCFEFKYLKNTIKSILKQKYINFEIIIIYDNHQRKDLKYLIISYENK